MIKPKWNAVSYDFASLYPNAMKDYTQTEQERREIERQKLIESRLDKLKKINGNDKI